MSDDVERVKVQTINGWTVPDRIWLMDLGCGDVTWCEDPDPDGEQVDSVEYVRAALTASRSYSDEIEEALEDCRTHERAWRSALELAKARAVVEPPDLDDQSYWQHEIKAFDRTFAALKVQTGERHG